MKRLLPLLLALFAVLPFSSCQRQTGELTIVQYNVGAFRKYEQSSIELAARLVKEMGADVVSLNEVDRFVSRSGNVDQAALFAEEMGGWNSHFGKAIDLGAGEYGVALAAAPQHQVVARHVVPLAQGDGSEARALAVVEFEDFVFASTHLDYASPEAQLAQARQITQWMKARYGESDKPVIVAGDFNAGPDSKTIADFQRDWTLLSEVDYSFSTEELTEKIDYIFALNNKARLKSLGGGVVYELQSGDVRLASDHYPLCVKIRYAVPKN